jgi:hypothetical protein
MASGRAETAMCTPAVEMTQACAAPPTHPAQTDGSYTLTVQGTKAARSVSSSQFALMINHLARARHRQQFQTSFNGRWRSATLTVSSAARCSRCQEALQHSLAGSGCPYASSSTSDTGGLDEDPPPTLSPQQVARRRSTRMTSGERPPAGAADRLRITRRPAAVMPRSSAVGCPALPVAGGPPAS